MFCVRPLEMEEKSSASGDLVDSSYSQAFPNS